MTASIANHHEAIGHHDATMPEKCVGNCDRVLIILARRRFPSGLILVAVGYDQDQRFELHHDQRLNKVAIYRVSHPAPPRFDLEPTAPIRMESINFILKIGLPVFAEEDGPPYLISGKLTRFNDKTKFQ